MPTLVWIYLLLNFVLCVYSAQVVILGILSIVKDRWGRNQPAPPDLAHYPQVTVQLPIYNEARVVQRLLAAAAALDWPGDRLQIQVLDDSTDETRDLAAYWVDHHQRQGVPIVHLHRQDRVGYKAGALHAGIHQSTGEFIAIFDADFVPEPDFLQRLLPTMLEDRRLAFVQARWGHLNKNYSVVTLLQSVVIDSHFFIDQSVRYWAGLTMHFNGTAGIWRKAAILDCHGWHHDTLCEDLDLSFRALVRGWKPGFVLDVVVPAELSPQLQAFRQQQFRWAKGSAQCLKKLAPLLLASRLPWWKKVLALVHISGYAMNLLVLMQVLLGPWVGLELRTQDLVPLALLGLWNTWSFVFVYWLALRKGNPTNWRSCMLQVMPLLLLFGVGMSFNNSLALFQGVSGLGGNVFRRTPKFNVVRSADTWKDHVYRLPMSWMVWLELALGGYALAGAWLLFCHKAYFLIPLSCFYGLGFLVMSWASLSEQYACPVSPGAGAPQPPDSRVANIDTPGVDSASSHPGR